jgi:putative ABC transport system ATP-binding protein
MDSLIDLTDVTKVYSTTDAQPALNNVSLRIRAGEVVAVMGPSGSGKSTLLNLVAGLDRPSKGSITMDGIEINGLSEGALARYRRMKIGLIFQFFNLLDNLTVLDNVLIPAQLAGAGMSRQDSRPRARQLLETLGIGDAAERYPARLSGGQRQRVAIARALINRPALLLADEPTGALDTRSGEQVLDLLRDLNRAGQAIILVTHDPRLAERCADRTVTLVDGSIVRDTATFVRDTATMEAVR